MAAIMAGAVEEDRLLMKMAGEGEQEEEARREVGFFFLRFEKGRWELIWKLLEI